MHHVTLRYWAGARAAAGVESEQLPAVSLASALSAAKELRAGDAEFARVLDLCSLLLDGRAVHLSDLDTPLEADVEVELLPPFAGG